MTPNGEWGPGEWAGCLCAVATVSPSGNQALSRSQCPSAFQERGSEHIGRKRMHGRGEEGQNQGTGDRVALDRERRRGWARGLDREKPRKLEVGKTP